MRASDFGFFFFLLLFVTAVVFVFVGETEQSLSVASHSAIRLEKNRPPIHTVRSIMSSSRRLVSFALAFALFAVSSSGAQQRPEARNADTGPGDMRVLFKVFQECSKSQVSSVPSVFVDRSLSTRFFLFFFFFFTARTLPQAQAADRHRQDQRSTGNGLVRRRAAGERSQCRSRRRPESVRG